MFLNRVAASAVGPTKQKSEDEDSSTKNQNLQSSQSQYPIKTKRGTHSRETHPESQHQIASNLKTTSSYRIVSNFLARIVSYGSQCACKIVSYRIEFPDNRIEPYRKIRKSIRMYRIRIDHMAATISCLHNFALLPSTPSAPFAPLPLPHYLCPHFPTSSILTPTQNDRSTIEQLIV